MTDSEQMRRFGSVIRPQEPEPMGDGLHALFAGLATAAFVALAFASTADHWMTEYNAERIYQEAE